jgi:hypothetical protein
MVESSQFSPLPDPCNDRVVPESECPSLLQQPLADDVLFSKNGNPNWKVLKEF